MSQSTTPPIITRRSLPDQAADWLRHGIISGHLAPGSRLIETALAAEMGLSRSTARAGLLQIAGEGLVVQHAFAGWTVAKLSEKDAWEVYTLRVCLDGLAARIAAERLDDIGKAAAQRAYDVLAAATLTGNARDIASADVEFHTELVRHTGHERLMAQYALIRGSSLLYIAAANKRTTPDIIRDEHRRILTAVLAGDADAAEEHARRHMLDHWTEIAKDLAKT